MNLIKYRYLYFAISLAVIIPGILALIFWKLPLGIDFTGGSLLEVKFASGNPPTIALTATATEVVRRAVPAPAWTVALGRITVVFGVGQCLGPIAAGMHADSAPGIATGLAASAVLLVAGAAIAPLQRSGSSTR